ncbi:hypothetical protein QTP70_006477 [Hemibagrus guttatus]|uniref:Reverse transcriptase domain-containing protein n=1 Tax=Hemibagrus guttatus TaxID=175788 RepID=A0AAE0QFK6_9TELE|nr:hypothetical protein QTP70_006477 [Hemibagrus guttatus]
MPRLQRIPQGSAHAQLTRRLTSPVTTPDTELLQHPRSQAKISACTHRTLHSSCFPGCINKTPTKAHLSLCPSLNYLEVVVVVMVVVVEVWEVVVVVVELVEVVVVVLEVVVVVVEVVEVVVVVLEVEVVVVEVEVVVVVVVVVVVEVEVVVVLVELVEVTVVVVVEVVVVVVVVVEVEVVVVVVEVKVVKCVCCGVWYISCQTLLYVKVSWQPPRFKCNFVKPVNPFHRQTEMFARFHKARANIHGRRAKQPISSRAFSSSGEIKGDGIGSKLGVCDSRLNICDIWLVLLNQSGFPIPKKLPERLQTSSTHSNHQEVFWESGAYPQYAYQPNGSSSDAITAAFHISLSHLEDKDTYIRILFSHYSSTFNTVIPHKLTHKLFALGLHPTLCDWLLDFLTGRPQSVRIGSRISATITTNIGTPQGCVLSPIPYTLFTREYIASHKDNIILKFADNTAVIGRITGGDEVAYRREVASLVTWCEDYNLTLNTDKTKDMIVDKRKERRTHQPLFI